MTEHTRSPSVKEWASLRFKGLIWHSPEAYFRFKGLLPK